MAERPGPETGPATTRMRKVPCTHVNSYSSLDPPGRAATDHDAFVIPTFVDADEIMIEICPAPIGDDVYDEAHPFIEFSLTPREARELAIGLLEEASKADETVEKPAPKTGWLN